MKLKPGDRPRVLRGHPWVYANEIQELLGPDWNGRAVECRDARGRLLGSGIYNQTSQILWRKFSSGKTDFDRACLSQAIQAAIQRRNAEPVQRLVWSESDFIPGLVVDKYNNVLVVQALTLAVDRMTDQIGEILRKATGAGTILLKNDAPVRSKEGLGLEVRMLSGGPVEAGWTRIGEIEFWLDLAGGQKTGFYLDQRKEYSKVAGYCAGKRVLDAFCNQGGFALHAAKAGASEALGIDASSDAVALAEKNAAHNNLNAKFLAENVFDYFKRERKKTWDVIILDPPAFAKSREKLPEAMRGYKELNLRAFQRLSPGGILASYSCSHHVSHDHYFQMLAEAAADAGRTVRMLELCRQPDDHPVLLNVPESEYLRGFIMEVLG
ncbi:MAG: class I SAM-dependent rRNA methyltransferase [Methylacidiphilales bacterium]|nr:class I SAM-dependent rRNA methyltransferase [Candidatus Methylacidiphilales bacterium]